MVDYREKARIKLRTKLTKMNTNRSIKRTILHTLQHLGEEETRLVMKEPNQDTRKLFEKAVNEQTRIGWNAMQ